MYEYKICAFLIFDIGTVVYSSVEFMCCLFAHVSFCSCSVRVRACSLGVCAIHILGFIILWNINLSRYTPPRFPPSVCFTVFIFKIIWRIIRRFYACSSDINFCTPVRVMCSNVFMFSTETLPCDWVMPRSWWWKCNDGKLHSLLTIGKHR